MLINEILPKIIEKTKEKYIYLTLESCNTCMISFDLWMSRAIVDTFVLIVHFLNDKWEACHVTIGFFEIVEIFGNAMSLQVNEVLTRKWRKMKRRESLEFELSGIQATPKFDHEDKNREKMFVILFNRGKIYFSKMKKFQRWIIGRDLKWVWHVDVFSLLDIQLSLIRPLVIYFFANHHLI